MRSSLLAWPVTLVLASLCLIGCKTSVSVDESDPDPDPDPDTGCEEPQPEVPPGSWCPPIYQCIDGEWMDTGGACPEPECPATKPADGTGCELVGQTCAYQEDVPCGESEQVNVLCTESGWVASYSYCQPEPECPEDLPVVGTDCAGWEYAYACQYFLETGCGTQAVFVSCSGTESGQLWTLDSGPACAICKDHGTEAECSVAPDCQWLTPGCGPDPVQTGCYPKQGCDVSGCNDDSICVETTYDPCYGEPCDACGAPYFACLPGWAP